MILILEKTVLTAFVGGRIILCSSCMSEMLLCYRTHHPHLSSNDVGEFLECLVEKAEYICKCLHKPEYAFLIIHYSVTQTLCSVSRRITACFKPYWTLYIGVGNVWLLWVFPTWRDVPQMAFQTIFLNLKRAFSMYNEFCMKENSVKLLRCSQTVPVPFHFQLWIFEGSVLCWA